MVFTGSYSPQVLAPHLRAETTELIVVGGGVRWVPEQLCVAGSAGCFFVEGGLGLTWDTSGDEPGHGAPNGELTVTLGFGYRHDLGSNFHLGARIDAAYLESNYTSSLGWIIPQGLLGMHF